MSPRGGYRRAAGRELQLSLLTGMVRGADFEKVLENPSHGSGWIVQALPTKGISKTLRFARSSFQGFESLLRAKRNYI